jgi:NADH-quinone oxidoreductase subunit N
VNPVFANAVTAPDVAALLPTFIVAGTALVVLFFDFFAPKSARRWLAIGISILGLIVSGVMTAQQYGHPVVAFSGAYIVGGFSVIFSEITIVATILSLLLTLGVGRDDQIAGSSALVLWSTTGAMLMSGAGNLMMIFLGIELLSLGLYCLCGMSLRATARESALKYLILSSMASGFMLYGMALLFGATGSVSLAALASAHVGPLFAMGVGLFLIGIAFKLSLVPFHVWTPDVYEGAPLTVTAYMSVVTKAGVLAVLARIAYAALPAESATMLLVPMWAIAGLSMIVGNLAALAQTDLKRLLAYSGIAQVGYIVAAFAGRTDYGLRYAILYFAVYLFMNLGAFGVLALMSRDGETGPQLASFTGLAYRRPWLAGAMAFFLLSLAGLPPTGGFTAKILILASTTSAGYVWLALLLILGTAISVYVYFKIVRIMFVRADEAHVRDERGPNFTPWIGIAVCAAAVFVLCFYPLTPSDILPAIK